MARNDGLSPLGSFMYSVFVSTVVWEYGYEAFAEIPSIQDLFSTPVIGSLMGEYMYYIEGEIDKKHGSILGSKYLGNFAYFAIDPLGNIADTIGEFFDVHATMEFQTYKSYSSKEVNQYNRILQKPQQFSNYDYGFILNIEF